MLYFAQMNFKTRFPMLGQLGPRQGHALFLPNAFHLLKEDLSDQSRLFMQFIGIFEVLIAVLLHQIGKEGTQSIQQTALRVSKLCLVAVTVLTWLNKDMYANIYPLSLFMVYSCVWQNYHGR